MDTNRRSMLLTVGAAAAASPASLLSAAAGAKPGKGHDHAHHGVDRHNDARAEIADCIAAGEACLAHCIEALSTGTKSLAKCASAVRDMIPICQAMGPVIASRSPLLKDLAAVCIKSCERCEAECEPHVDHHAECRNCRDLCRRTKASIKTLLG
ncbi:MAG: four-helix bundle copper-binding protein [Myxococcota bacterium]